MILVRSCGCQSEVFTLGPLGISGQTLIQWLAGSVRLSFAETALQNKFLAMPRLEGRRFRECVLYAKLLCFLNRLLKPSLPTQVSDVGCSDDGRSWHFSDLAASDPECPLVGGKETNAEGP
jgi:hypothetical protein